MKSNRMFAYTHEEKLQGKFRKMSEAGLNPGVVYQVYLKGLDFPVSLVCQHFTNRDGSTGDLYLVCSDLGMDYEVITTIYHKRWKVEECHKSIKQNTGLGESPTRRVTTQGNHFLASIYAFCKLEMLKCKTSLNHLALKGKLYLQALKHCFGELQRMQEESGVVSSHNLKAGFA